MKINEKNLTMFAVSQPIDLDGYLQKRGEVNRSWQRRFFVLKGNLLFYFERRGDREPLGLIVIEGCTIELSEDGEPYCFQIVFHGINNRTYFLSAESQTQMEQWMKALTCAGYEYMKLMVSELQRQLDELEGGGTSAGGVGGGSDATVDLSDASTPRPPPRRQNPFNRSAPPIPTSAAAALRSNGGGNVPVVPNRTKVGGHQPYNQLNGGLVLSPSQLLLSNNGSGNVNTTNGTNGLSTTHPPALAATNNNNNHQHQQLSPAVPQRSNKPPATIITFEVLHAHFGRAVRKDLQAFSEKTNRPLISL